MKRRLGMASGGHATPRHGTLWHGRSPLETQAKRISFLFTCTQSFASHRIATHCSLAIAPQRIAIATHRTATKPNPISQCGSITPPKLRYTYVYVHVYICLYKCTSMYVYVCICVFTYIYVYVCIYIYMYVAVSILF